MANVAPKVSPVNAPQSMRLNDRWLNWRYEQKKGGKKTKVPCDATGKKVDGTKGPDASRTFMDAFTASVPGVGYSFQGDDGLVFIDLDHAADEKGVLRPWAAPLLAELCRVGYVERSPSGEGFHAFVKGKVEHSLKVPYKGGHVEVYASVRFSTITGDRLLDSGLEVGDGQAVIDGLVALAGGKVEKKESATPAPGRPADFDVEEVRYMLMNFCDANMDEPDWKNVVWAIHLASGGSEEGFALVDEWSATATRAGAYTEDGVAEKWSRARLEMPKGKKAVTLGTVVKQYAMPNGYKPKVRSASKAFTALPPLTPDEEPGVIEDLTGKYIRVAKQMRYFDRQEMTDFSVSAIDARHREQWQKREMDVDDGGKMKRPKHPHFYIDTHCEEVVDFVWYPGRGVITDFQGFKCVNTWRQPEAITPGGDAGPWLAHAEYLIPDKMEREHVLDWLAFCVQHLDDKIHHAIVLYEPTGGTGKDLFMQPVRNWFRAVGAWRAVGVKELNGNFDHYLAGTKLLCVKEAKEQEHGLAKSFYDEMKEKISSPDALRVNMKNRQPFEVPNLLNIVVLTNYENAVYIEQEDDRRWFFCSCNQKRHEDAADYYKPLWKWMAENWRNAISYLLTRDVTKFDHAGQPPMTALKKSAFKATRPQAEQDLDRALLEFGEKPFTQGELRERIGFAAHPQTKALLDNVTKMSKLLYARGYVSDRTRVEGEKKNLWFKKEYSLAVAVEMYTNPQMEA
jgi:hypothetical protein